MPLQGVATWRHERKHPLTLRVDGAEITVTRADLATLTTAEQVSQLVANLAATSRVQLPPITVHINRDRSIAIATGKPPETWPEDERDKPGQEVRGKK